MCVLFVYLTQVPETLQYRVVRTMSRQDMSVLSTMAEAPGILQAKPRLTGKRAVQAAWHRLGAACVSCQSPLGCACRSSGWLMACVHCTLNMVAWRERNSAVDWEAG